MKSNIDLTRGSDFHPNKFKAKSIKSQYYDDINGDPSRLPWNKDGHIYDNHKVIISWGDTLNTTLTWTNLTSGEVNFTYSTNGLFDSDFTTNSPWTITMSNVRPLYSDFDLGTATSFNNWGSIATFTTNNTTNYIRYTYNSDGKYLLNKDTKNKTVYTGKGNGIRLGKVSKIRDTYIPNYKTILYKRVPWSSYDVYKCDKVVDYNEVSVIKKYNWHGAVFGKHKSEFTEYRGYINDALLDSDVGTYKSIREHGLATKYDTILCEILDQYISNPEYLYKYDEEKYLYRYNRYKMALGDMDDKEVPRQKRVIKWPDFHGDYIREMEEGLKPRNDWRRGKKGTNNLSFMQEERWIG